MNGTTWPTLDPSVGAAQVTSGQPIFAAIYGSLFEASATGKIVPDLATGYRVSDGGLQVQIMLRHGVKFQDGTPFNAQAVAFNLNRDRNPSNACLCLSYVQPIASISTPSEYTVDLHLSQPYSPLIMALATTSATYMVSPAAFQKEGADAFGLHPVGAGPFEVSSNTPNAKLVLTRFDGYWNRPKPYVDTIVMNYIDNSTTADESVQSGAAQLDIGNGTSPQTAKQAEHQAGVTVTSPPANGEYFVHFNTFAAPFNKLAAREAVAYATNPQAINRAVFLGLNRPVDAMSAPGQSFYPKGKLTSYHQYDPKKARRLVQQLGGLSFTIMCVPCTYGYLTQAEALQQEWSQVGIHATIVNLAEPEAVARFRAGNFQTTMSSWQSFDPAIELGLFAASSGTLNHGQNDPVLNQELGQAAATLKPGNRAVLYRRIYNLINDKVYNLPTVQDSVYDIMSKKVHGLGDNFNVYLEDAWLS